MFWSATGAVNLAPDFQKGDAPVSRERAQVD
jgi:hypothetical protein